MSRNIYEPIRKKVEEWLWYDENQPKCSYAANVEEHNRFRSLHDRETIRSVGDIGRKYIFLREFIKGDNIEKLLPETEAIVHKLSELFERGMGRENVFLLPERQLNCARARKPYYDYVPVMLLEAFPDGTFSSYWDSPEAYLQWINEEHLEMFFDGSISREHVRDLSGCLTIISMC